jgi:Cof subfamily protein (haloacid dehalogenase superfamily)
MDLDGTLLTDDKKITRENLDTIHNLIKKGYEVVIATGRNYFSARQLTKEINDNLIYVSNNGNIIRDSKDDKIILNRFLDFDDYKKMLIEGDSRGLNPIVYVDYFERGYDVIFQRDSEHGEYFNSVTRNMNRYIEVDNILDYKIDRILALVYPGQKDILKEFYSYINREYPKLYNSHVMENVVMSEALLEIMNPFGTKWNSLKEYALKRNIRPEEIITIGDDNNDIDMIQNAGLGISMINGSSLVKENADIITKKDNNNSGLSYELNRILNI